MKLYFAGPLFSAAERSWNAELAGLLRAAGHDVFVPQENEPGKDAAQIFAADVAALDWADAVVAIMDGPDPDSGTAWEVGYSFRKMPIVLVRTDFRVEAGPGGPYNPMLTQAATIRVDVPFGSMDEIARAVIDALARLDRQGVRP
jgi:nucleoside 2-deoxyribosyltransferase